MHETFKLKYFESFIVCPSNYEAYKFALAFSTSNIGNPCVLLAASGNGKTHLLAAIETEFARLHPNASIAFASVGCDFSPPLIIPKNMDVLLLDDLSGSMHNPESVDSIVREVNCAIENGTRVFIAIATSEHTGHTTRDFIATFWPEARIERINSPSIEERLAFAKVHAAEIKLEISEESLNDIAKLSKSMREVEGYLIVHSAGDKLGKALIAGKIST